VPTPKYPDPKQAHFKKIKGIGIKMKMFVTSEMKVNYFQIFPFIWRQTAT
jgi:hypothetical protein